jgi:hypothetical protein
MLGLPSNSQNMATCSSETLVGFHRTTWCIPEDRALQKRNNFPSHLVSLVTLKSLLDWKKILCRVRHLSVGYVLWLVSHHKGSLRRFKQFISWSRFWRVLKMVNNTQNYWIFGLCPSSGILETRKHVSETGSVSAFRWDGRTPTQLGPLERANLNHWTMTIPWSYACFFVLLYLTVRCPGVHSYVSH